ncbi:MAG: tetratricopeptide repeat protein [Tannerellaceae bacterium]|nr:tetratricopeptide repeat protein [Tannerellaceae bacterium]
MKTTIIISCVALGVIAAAAALISNNIVYMLATLIIAVVGVLLTQIFKAEPAIVTPEIAANIVDDTLLHKIALRDKTIEELQQQLAEKDLPDYLQATKPFVEKGEYAKAIARLDAYKKEKDAEFYIFRARLYIANSQFDEACGNYNMAVDTWPSFDNTLAAAKFYYSLNRFREAQGYLKHCLEMELSAEQRASVLNNLGMIFWQSNEYSEAEKAYAEALEIARRLNDEDPQTYKPGLAVTLNNLGALCGDKGEYGQAEERYNEALEIYRELAKKDSDKYNPVLAITLNNLGEWHRDKAEYTQAEAYHKNALQLYREMTAKDAKTHNPDLATSLNNLGTVYYNMKDYEEAEKYHTEALAIRRELARNNPQAYNPDLASSLNSLGNFYADKPAPDYAKAEAFYKECTETYGALAAEYPKAWNPHFALVLVNMSLFYQYQRPDKVLSIQHAAAAVLILDLCSDDSALVRRARKIANAVLAAGNS